MMTDRVELDEIVAQWARERPDIDAACMADCGAIWRAGHRLNQGLKANMTRFGLDFPTLDVLLTLRRQGRAHAMSPSAMAVEMMLSTAAMTARVDRLEKRGLIARQPDPEDRRGVRISLTEQGWALADEVVVGHVAAEEAMLSGLSLVERQQLRGLLARVASD